MHQTLHFTLFNLAIFDILIFLMFFDTLETVCNSSKVENESKSSDFSENSVIKFMKSLEIELCSEWQMRIYSIGKHRNAPNNVDRTFDCRIINNPAKHLNLKKLNGKSSEVKQKGFSI